MNKIITNIRFCLGAIGSDESPPPPPPPPLFFAHLAGRGQHHEPVEQPHDEFSLAGLPAYLAGVHRLRPATGARRSGSGAISHNSNLRRGSDGSPGGLYPFYNK